MGRLDRVGHLFGAARRRGGGGMVAGFSSAAGKASVFGRTAAEAQGKAVPLSRAPDGQRAEQAGAAFVHGARAVPVMPRRHPDQLAVLCGPGEVLVGLADEML